ncbi:MAG: 2-amino-4-hydroxy-6-hydroxymethyldihydropteridine diphosphokinase [Proteobacteria bacterium]|nr:2-amino-4-hydroxy-6-hydroxymethyldihydropteridine diphosphokinase [Pseudomonadota bacterium]
MHVAYLSLGSNLDPERHLRAAADALRARFGEVAFSAVLRTPAMGFDGPDFLNAAAIVRTELDVHALDAWLHALEAAQGRDRSGPRFGSRTLDIDIVLFDDLELAPSGDSHLQIPRPDLRHGFVLQPLAQIAPDTVVPGDGRTLAALWAARRQHAVRLPPADLRLD